MVRDQRLGDAVIPFESGGDERRQPGAAGQVRIGAFRQKQRHGRGFLRVGGGVERGAALDIARVDRRASVEKQLDQLDLAAARGVGERHVAMPVARQQRGAGIEELPRQRLAAAVGRRDQRHVGLHRTASRSMS